jgi:hypothetical protein
LCHKRQYFLVVLLIYVFHIYVVFAPHTSPLKSSAVVSLFGP